MQKRHCVEMIDITGLDFGQTDHVIRYTTLEGNARVLRRSWPFKISKDFGYGM